MCIRDRFDSFCFQDWGEAVAIPFFKNVEGPKFLIGDNLASHLSVDVIKLCDEKNIRFVFLPSNSTHMMQPIDVAFFRPMKFLGARLWRNERREVEEGRDL